MVPDIIQANIHVIGNCSLLSPMRVMCSIVCSKSVPGNDSEMIPAPLSIRLCELKETGSPLFAQFELQQNKTSERERDDIHDTSDDIHDTSDANEESNQQEIHADTIKKILMNRRTVT